jgi:iron complex outermembrane receptor protein
MSSELHNSRIEVITPAAFATGRGAVWARVFMLSALAGIIGWGASLERTLAAEPGASQSVQPASSAPPKADELAEIQVTGTRIVGGGYDAPNPITTLGAVRLEELAITDVGDALNRLPSFRATLTPQTTEDGAPTNLGERIVDLRGLGANRTLVLVDGRRFVPSNSQGTVDLNNIPTNLIDRVEVVTGGASATSSPTPLPA